MVVATYPEEEAEGHNHALPSQPGQRAGGGGVVCGAGGAGGTGTGGAGGGGGGGAGGAAAAGWDRARTIAPGARGGMADSATVPLDRPMNTSAPHSAGSVEPVRLAWLVRAASAALTGFSPSRPR